MTSKYYFLAILTISTLFVIFRSKGVSFISTSLNSGNRNGGTDKYSTSTMMTSSVSMVMNGKEKYVNSQHEEVYEDKLGEGPAQVRAYKDAFEKKNDNPGVFVRQADTNVEPEKKILGEEPEVFQIDDSLNDMDDEVSL